MRVLQINATYGIGSTGKIVRAIDSLATENGIESYVAYSYTSERGRKNGYQVGNRLSWKLHALLSRIRGRQAYYSYLATLRLIHHIKRLAPDVVHLHNVHNNYLQLNLLLDFLAKARIRTVITLHDCWFYTGGCFHYTSVGCEKWKTGCHDCRKHDTFSLLGDSSSSIWKDRRKRLLEIEDLTVIGCSEWIAGEVAESFLKEKRCIVIYNGFDLDIFKPTSEGLKTALGLGSDKIILGPASKWLLAVNRDALEYFASSLEDGEVFLLFGAADTGIEVPANVRLAGYTSNQKELAELYSMADVFVNCSREDTLSSINIECQACGTPVVTYDSTGSKETVDGIHSKAVKTGDFHALYQSMREVLDSGKHSDEIRKWVSDHFDARENLRHYIDLYLNVRE